MSIEHTKLYILVPALVAPVVDAVVVVGAAVVVTVAVVAVVVIVGGAKNCKKYTIYIV